MTSQQTCKQTNRKITSRHRLHKYIQPVLSAALLSLSSLTVAAPASVIELFTSHGCSSCPPADELLSDLIKADPDIVALEFHVDYWNQLVHGSSGSWADPFSDAAYTERQHFYHAAGLSGRQGVYTPQMVVNGEYAAVGSDSLRIGKQLQEDRVAPVSVDIERTNGASLTINLEGNAPDDATIWLVIFDIEKTTDITSGENKDLTIVNHHIVKEMRALDNYRGSSQSLMVPLMLAAGEGCAVLVQAELPGPVSGAANCPAI